MTLRQQIQSEAITEDIWKGNEDFFPLIRRQAERTAGHQQPLQL